MGVYEVVSWVFYIGFGIDIVVDLFYCVVFFDVSVLGDEVVYVV